MLHGRDSRGSWRPGCHRGEAGGGPGIGGLELADDGAAAEPPRGSDGGGADAGNDRADGGPVAARHRSDRGPGRARGQCGTRRSSGPHRPPTTPAAPALHRCGPSSRPVRAAILRVRPTRATRARVASPAPARAPRAGARPSGPGSRRRRWSARRSRTTRELTADDASREHVVGRLRDGRSPRQIAGGLKRQRADGRASVRLASPGRRPARSLERLSPPAVHRAGAAAWPRERPES